MRQAKTARAVYIKMCISTRYMYVYIDTISTHIQSTCVHSQTLQLALLILITIRPVKPLCVQRQTTRQQQQQQPGNLPGNLLSPSTANSRSHSRSKRQPPSHPSGTTSFSSTCCCSSWHIARRFGCLGNLPPHPTPSIPSSCLSAGLSA